VFSEGVVSLEDESDPPEGVVVPAEELDPLEGVVVPAEELDPPEGVVVPAEELDPLEGVVVPVLELDPPEGVVVPAEEPDVELPVPPLLPLLPEEAVAELPSVRPELDEEPVLLFLELELLLEEATVPASGLHTVFLLSFETEVSSPSPASSD
jgi:hypothetical protein